MHCISTFGMQVVWNDELTDCFLPTRGIRCRDLLSPYLFVFCIERLAQFIEVAISAGIWKHFYLTKNGIPISHFPFADYFILFAKGSLDQVSKIRFADYLSIINYCLETFSVCSGQKVNKSKSRIFFSKNVNHIGEKVIDDAIGFTVTFDSGKYLGILLHHKKDIQEFL